MSEINLQTRPLATNQYYLQEKSNPISDSSTRDSFRLLLEQKMKIATKLNAQLNNPAFKNQALPSFADMLYQVTNQQFQPHLNTNIIKNIEDKQVPPPTKHTAEPSHARKFDDIVKEAAQKYKVSEKLIHAIIKTESNYNPRAKSQAGAAGLMQLMPGTAKYLGVSDPYHVRQNIFGGTKYISQMLRQHGGNIDLALAAYNAGPGNVKKYGGIPPFKETQNYVRKIKQLIA